MFRRLWVRILALITGWNFFHMYVLDCLFEKMKINKKRPGMAIKKG